MTDATMTPGDGTLVVPERVSVLHVPSSYDLRADLEEIVIRDMLGPAGGPIEEADGAVAYRRLPGRPARPARPSPSVRETEN